MEILKSFIFQICAIGTACYALAFITRHIFEAGFQSLKVTDAKQSTMARWWNEVILFALPVIYGNVLCLLLRMTSFFTPEFKSIPAAVVLGTALGFMSGFLYKVLKRLIMREVDPNTPAPPITDDGDPKP